METLALRAHEEEVLEPERLEEHHADTSFGRTGRRVSEIGFGAWAIGGSWGAVDESDAVAALNACARQRHDVHRYRRRLWRRPFGALICTVLKERGGEQAVRRDQGRPAPAAADCRRLYRRESPRLVERSLTNLEVETLDLVQLHCPPTDLYYHPEVFDSLDRLKKDGKIRDYGVSVERIEEAIKALEYPGVVSVQIIFNIFRQRPADLFFDLAKRKQVAVIARVPLASGLLTGKLRADSSFADDDHRKFNRHGEAFDVGETFSGVPYDVGLAAVERVRKLIGDDVDDGAIRAALDPDVRRRDGRDPRGQERGAGAGQRAGRRRPPLSPVVMAELKAIYDQDIRPHVHQRW